MSLSQQGEEASKDQAEQEAVVEALAARLAIPASNPTGLPDCVDAEAQASHLMTPEEIAAVQRCSCEALKERCGRELARGRLLASARLHHEQWEKAVKGETRLLLWLGKQILKQGEKGPMVEDLDAAVEFTLDLGPMRSEERIGE